MSNMSKKKKNQTIQKPEEEKFDNKKNSDNDLSLDYEILSKP